MLKIVNDIINYYWSFDYCKAFDIIKLGLIEIYENQQINYCLFVIFAIYEVGKVQLKINYKTTQ